MIIYTIGIEYRHNRKQMFSEQSDLKQQGLEHKAELKRSMDPLKTHHNKNIILFEHLNGRQGLGKKIGRL